MNTYALFKLEWIMIYEEREGNYCGTSLCKGEGVRAYVQETWERKIQTLLSWDPDGGYERPSG